MAPKPPMNKQCLKKRGKKVWVSSLVNYGLLRNLNQPLRKKLWLLGLWFCFMQRKVNIQNISATESGPSRKSCLLTYWNS